MKGSGETKLLLILGLIVLLGGGAMYGLNVLSSQPEKPHATPTPFSWNETTFNDIVKDAAHVRESPDAKITVVEFADFQCPACRRAYDYVLRDLEKTKSVRFIFRHLPFTDMHPNAMGAATAAEAAANQGKFWEMYDAVFTGVKDEIPFSEVTKRARKIGLDMTKFDKDRADAALQRKVESDKALADRFKIGSTPTFIVRDPQGKFTQVTGGKDLKDILEKLGVKF